MLRTGIVATVMLLCGVFSLGCVTRTSVQHASRECRPIAVEVTIKDDRGRLGRPGAPIDIVVRSLAGRVLGTAVSDSNGIVSVDVCWNEDDPPTQVEAKLLLGKDFIGSIVSFDQARATVCLTLPPFRVECGSRGAITVQ